MPKSLLALTQLFDERGPFQCDRRVVRDPLSQTQILIGEHLAVRPVVNREARERIPIAPKDGHRKHRLRLGGGGSVRAVDRRLATVRAQVSHNPAGDRAVT